MIPRDEFDGKGKRALGSYEKTVGDSSFPRNLIRREKYWQGIEEPTWKGDFPRNLIPRGGFIARCIYIQALN